MWNQPPAYGNGSSTFSNEVGCECNLHIKWNGYASPWARWALACNILVCHMTFCVILCYIVLCSLTWHRFLCTIGGEGRTTFMVWWSYPWGCDIHLLEWGEHVALWARWAIVHDALVGYFIPYSITLPTFLSGEMGTQPPPLQVRLACNLLG